MSFIFNPTGPDMPNCDSTESDCQRVYILSLETMGVDTSRWAHLTDFVGHSIGALSCFFPLSRKFHRFTMFH